MRGIEKLVNRREFDLIVEDMIKALSLPDYEAVEVLWVALTKFANLLPETSEHKRMLNLVSQLSIKSLNYIVSDPSIDELLKMDPPLETILANPHERLCLEETKQAINNFYVCRGDKPLESVLSLGEILKRIRNKRAHGFKTRSGPRDQVILKTARSVLQRMCDTIAEKLNCMLENNKN
jgi:hypothetical protein